MRHPLLASMLLACLGAASCSRSASGRLLGTWRAESKMTTRMYQSHLPHDPARPDPSDPGVPIQLPWQVTITRDKFKMTLGPSDERVGGRTIHAPLLRIEKSYALVSERGDELVIAIEQDKSPQPILDTIHFVDRDRFWMVTGGKKPADAGGPRMWFDRVR